MHRVNWDDLRFVLAVADTGSVGAAARRLGVNHATVLRRVAAFEETHGGAVLHRGASGYEVLPERLAVIEAARLAAAAFDQAAGLMRGEAAAGHAVRITSTDSLCIALLPQVLARLTARDPQLRVELRSSNAHRNLGRLEADITVRPTITLPPDLVGVLAGTLDFAVYHAAERPPDDDTWLGLGGPLAGSVAGAWLAGRTPPVRPVLAADSFVVLAQLAENRQGRAILPTLLGDPEPGLQRDMSFGIVASAPLWVASHVELAQAPRLEALRQALADEILAVHPRRAAAE